MIKVGCSVVFDEKKGKERKVAYSDIYYDFDKWADIDKFLPADFDLVYLKCHNYTEMLSGWCNGNSWDGLNVKKKHKITHWKKHE